MPELKLGIALGSGAARGWAHIGVLNALNERGIKPAIVAGASVGALVGGAYASNKLDKLESWALGLSRIDVLGMLDARFRGGVIRGNRIMQNLSTELGSNVIEDLEIAYAAVATDLYSGREIWLREGQVLAAVRASCGLPGLFSPMRYQDRWLIDGGVVNPVPVSLCHAMGADVVIGVNLNGHLAANRYGAGRKFHESEKQRSEELTQFEKLAGIFGSLFGSQEATPGILDVVHGSVNIMQERITRSRMAGEPPHLEIVPFLQDIELMDFHRAEDTIKAGYVATARLDKQLEDLSTVLAG